MASPSRQMELAQSISAVSEALHDLPPDRAASPDMRDALYRLLPEVYRNLDGANGYPMRKVMAVLDSLAMAIEGNIQALYDDWFVETCAPWALPLIAELVGADDPDTPGNDLPRQRERIANTRLYKANAGQPDVIARAVGAAGGWPTCAQNGTDTLLATQNLRFPGLVAARTVNLRDARATAGINQPFSKVCRSVAVTTNTLPDQRGATLWTPRGVPNQMNLALFNIQATPLARTEASWDRRIGAFALHPGGLQTPLYRPAQTPDGPLTARTAREVPQSVSAAELDELAASAPAELPIRVWVGSGRGRFSRAEAISPENLIFGPLERGNIPVGRKVLIDPDRGQLRLGSGFADVTAPRVWATFYRGTLGRIGGGFAPAAAAPAPVASWTAVVGNTPWSYLPESPDRPQHSFASLTKAIEAFEADAAAYLAADRDRAAMRAVIYIADSSVHAVPRRQINLHGQSLTIMAMPGLWPTLTGLARVRNAEEIATLMLDGLFIHGAIEARGAMDIAAVDCTIGLRTGAELDAPPAIAGQATRSDPIHLSLGNCVCGPIRMTEHCQLTAADSVIEANPFDRLAIGALTEGQPGPVCRFDAVTILGKSMVRQLVQGTELLTTGPILASYGEGHPASPANLAWWSRQPGQPGYAVPFGGPDTSGQAETDNHDRGASLGAFGALNVDNRLRAARAAADEFLVLGQDARFGWVGQ